MADLFNQPVLKMEFQAVHKRENNPASEFHLEQFRKKFTHDCYEVLQLLVSGERLTVRGAVISGLSNSLPRRILDLKKFGVKISDQWQGKREYIEYYMTSEDKSMLAELLMSKMEIAA